MQTLFSGLTLVTAFIAYLTYRANLRQQEENRIRKEDKELTKQARASLEWAYNVLTANGSQIPPASDRTNWLTSARHLLRQEKIAAQIQSQIYKTVQAEHEDFWRHRFYTALQHDALSNSSYWSSDDEEYPEQIELTSALVVVRFSNWRPGLTDPTDEVDREEILQDRAALAGRAGRSLRAYSALLSQAAERRRTRP